MDIDSSAQYLACLPCVLLSLPLIGAGCAIAWRSHPLSAWQIAIWTSGVTAAIALLMAIWFAGLISASEVSSARCSTQLAGFKARLSLLSEQHAGSGEWRTSLTFGIDDVNFIPILAFSLVTWLALLQSSRSYNSTVPIGLLLGLVIMLALLTVQDALLFIAAGEGLVWWLYGMTALNGGPERRTAAKRMLGSLWISQAALELAILGLAANSAWVQSAFDGRPLNVSFAFSELLDRQQREVFGNEIGLRLWLETQPWVWLCWLVFCSIRLLMVPLHQWWMPFFTQARGEVAVIGGAAILLNTLYTWDRFIAPFLTSASGWEIQWLLWCSLGMIWCGLSAMTRQDRREKMALWFVAILQLAVCGLASGSAIGSLNGFCLIVASCLALTTLIPFLHCQPDAQIQDGLTCSLIGTLIAIFATGGLSILFVIANQTLMILPVTVFGLYLIVRGMAREIIPLQQDNQSRTCVTRLSSLIFTFTVLALSLTAGLWKPQLQAVVATWHDPILGPGLQSTVVLIPVISQFPPVSLALSGWPHWLNSEMVWGMLGLTLILVPRRVTGSSLSLLILCLSGLLTGLAMEFAAANSLKSESLCSPGTTVCCLFLAGFTSIAVRKANEAPFSAEQCGALFLRLASVMFASRNHNLLLSGLAWELAGLTGDYLRLFNSDREPQPDRHGSYRRLIGSVCFWSGAIFFWAADQKLPADSPLAIPALILLLSGVGSRCGLLPWTSTGVGSTDRLEFSWLDRVSGFILLSQVCRIAGPSHGLMTGVMFSLSAMFTMLQTAAVTFREDRIGSVLACLTQWHMGLLILLLAAHAFGMSDEAPPQLRQSFNSAHLSGQQLLITTLAICGLTTGLLWVSGAKGGGIFATQLQGLLSRQRIAGICILVLWASLLFLPCGSSFWNGSMSLTQLWLSWQIHAGDSFRPNPVHVTGALLAMATLVCHVLSAARTFQLIVMEFPVGTLPASPDRWLKGITCGCATGVMIYGWWL